MTDRERRREPIVQGVDILRPATHQLAPEVYEQLKDFVSKKPQALQAMKMHFGVRDDSACIFEIESGPTNMSREWSGIITVKDSSSDDTVGFYLLKPTHDRRELQASLHASQLQVGPPIIAYYTPEGLWCDKQRILEEYYPHFTTIQADKVMFLPPTIENRSLIKPLTDDEQIVVGKALAQKVFNMYSHASSITAVPGGDLNMHLFIVGSGDTIDIRIVDWGQSRSLQDAQLYIENISSNFSFIFDKRHYLGIPTIKYFIEKMKQLITYHEHCSLYERAYQLCVNNRFARQNADFFYEVNPYGTLLSI